jgi:hypothetical protein
VAAKKLAGWIGYRRNGSTAAMIPTVIFNAERPPFFKVFQKPRPLPETVGHGCGKNPPTIKSPAIMHDDSARSVLSLKSSANCRLLSKAQKPKMARNSDCALHQLFDILVCLVCRLSQTDVG